MAHFISDECISCGSCASVCPVECISQGDSKYVVDESQCIDCGSCESACLTGAIAAKE